MYISQFVLRADQAYANRQWNLIEALHNAGHQVDVVTSAQHHVIEKRVSWGNILFKPQLRYRTEHLGGITVYRLFTPTGLRKGLLKRLLSYFSFFIMASLFLVRRPKYDLVLSSLASPLVGILGYLTAKRARAHFICDIRDIWPDAAVHAGILRWNIITIPMRFLFGFVTRHSDHNVVISPGIKAHLENIGVPHDKITVIPNGVDDQIFDGISKDSSLSRDDVGIRHADSFVVMFCGAFGRGHNDLISIVEAAESLAKRKKQIEFVFIGDGEQKNEIMEYVRLHRIHNCHFLPSQPKSRLPDFLNKADLCILTLPNKDFYKIFFQLKLFDYMGAAKPVIGAVRGNNAELIMDSGGGFIVPPENPRILAQEIEKISCMDREFLREKGRKAYSYVMKYFKRSDLVKRYVSLCESLVQLDGSSLYVKQ